MPPSSISPGISPLPPGALAHATRRSLVVARIGSGRDATSSSESPPAGEMAIGAAGERRKVLWTWISREDKYASRSVERSAPTHARDDALLVEWGWLHSRPQYTIHRGGDRRQRRATVIGCRPLDGRASVWATRGTGGAYERAQVEHASSPTEAHSVAARSTGPSRPSVRHAS